jgi:MOSC domain-containing protein YiiM
MPGQVPKIVSIQVGRIRSLGFDDASDPHDKPWATAFFKEPVPAAVYVGPTGIAGDEQADRENHGGPDKALLAYSADHYAHWRSHLQIADMQPGSFGENLTISGLDESCVSIGDVWQAGDVQLQVSQPRQPCWKMSRRWRIDDLARQVIANGKSGWYLRVLQEGELAAGMSIELLNRTHPHWTVARASDIMHHRQHDLAAAAELASLAPLSASWQESLRKRIAKRA